MVRLRVIGECSMQVGASHVGPEAERLFATLLVLATERGRRVSRTRLLELIWPGADERNGRHNLRQTIYKLRQLGAAVEVTGGYLELPASEVAGGLDGLVTSSEFAADDVPLDAPFDEWLPGYAPAFSRPLQEWVEKQRDYVHAQVRRALVKAIMDRRAGNLWPEVDALARRCLALDPLNEEATLALAESAAMTGSKTTALRILDAYLTELGADAGDIAMPAKVLRRRIAERLAQPRYVDPSEAYFVGRAPIMADFGTALQSTRGGFGSAHLVWGPSGIGKTRLTMEVGKLAALQGFRIHRATCQSSDAGRPLSIFADAVPALRKLPGAAGVDPKSVKYLKRLSEYDEALAEPPEDPYDSAVLFANVRRSVFDLFDAVTAECSLLFVIDDAQWLDAMSWGVLRELMEGARSHRLLVLCTSRTPHATAEPPVEATRGLTVHRLPALDGPACTELLDAVTRDATRGRPDAKLREWTLTVAQGNPLFVRALIGHWMNGYAEYTLPPSLESLIEQRLDRLTPSALRVLQACAVLGKNSTLGLLTAILTYSAIELIDALHILDELGLLVVSEQHVGTKHEVLRSIVLRRMGDAERTLWNRCIGLELRAIALRQHSAPLLWDSVDHLALAGENTSAEEAVIGFSEYLAGVGLIDDAATVLLEASARFESFLRRDDSRGALLQSLLRAWRWTDLRDVTRGALETFGGGQKDLLPTTRLRLTQLHAEWLAGMPLGPILAQLSDTVKDPRLPTQIRLESALEGMMVADNHCDWHSAQTFFEAVTRLLFDRSDATNVLLPLRLVTDAVCGDLGLIASTSGALVVRARLEGDKLGIADALRMAAQALHVAGYSADAVKSLEECWGLLAGDPAHPRHLRTLCLLAEIEADRGDLYAASNWSKIALDLSETLNHHASRTNVLISSARIAAQQGDGMTSQRLWSPTRETFTDSRNAREQGWISAQRLYLANYGLVELADGELAAIDDQFTRLQYFTGFDFLFAQLMKALGTSGQSERGREIRDLYLGKTRRARYPLPRGLGQMYA